eukprot:337723_1
MASALHQCDNTNFNVLILGDGDFSFTSAFCEKLKFCNGSQFPLLLYLKQQYNNNTDTINVNIISTSFDDRTTLIQKYPNSESILKKLNLLNNPSNKQIKKEKKLKFKSKDVLIHLKLIIKHQIDATNLSIFYNNTKTIFDLIIFNHPHLGFEHVYRNSSLLMHILFECNKIINKQSIIWITLIENQFEHWNVSKRMKQNDLNKQLTVLCSFLFFDKYYPGYVTKRHQSNKSFRRNRPSKRQQNDNQKQQIQSYNFIFVSNKCEQHPFKKYVSLMKESINECIKFTQINTSFESNNICCKQCGKIFMEKRSLISHMKSKQCLNDKNNNSVYKCDKCNNKEFNTLKDFEQHNIAKHKGINKNIKPDWYEKDEQKKQEENNNGMKETIECNLCDKIFENEIQHKQWITPGIVNPMEMMITEYKCNHCCKIFTFHRDLLQHSNICF